MFKRITFASRPGGFFMFGGVIFGSYSAETVSVLGSALFISTDGASGDTYAHSSSGDGYTQGARDDEFTKGGGKA